jgi:hypothetical protein
MIQELPVPIAEESLQSNSIEHDPDRLPVFRTIASMISDEGKGE